MKKIIFVLIFLAIILPVYSQNNSGNTTDLYYLNVPIEKIYPTNMGYIIFYRKSTNQIGTIGIPIDWFTDAAGRGELIQLPKGRDWPTMSIFYKNGEFSHIRLYVHRHKRHTTWGLVSGYPDISGYFAEPDTFKIDY